MNRIKQVKDYINPTSPFKIRYNYEIDVNMDLDEVPEEYRDFVFEQAKQMEEEQIMEAHYAPKYGCFSQQYYKETFGDVA